MSVGDEGSGGVLGVRAWAADAAERVKRLLPALGGGMAPPRAYDASVAELDQLVRLLDHDPALRSAVSMWLGGALALRQLADAGGVPADRERAESLLREVRDPATALGSTAGEEDRRWAALFLLPLVSPLQPQSGFGMAPDFSALVEWVARSGPTGMMSAAAEIRTLAAEVAELPLPPEFLDQMRRMQDMFSAPPGDGFSDLLASMIPDGHPFADHMRHVTGRLFDQAAGASRGGRKTASDSDSAPGSPRNSGSDGTSAPHSAPPGEQPVSSDPSPVDPASPPETGPSAARSGPAPSAAPPADPESVLTPDALRRFAAALDAVNATNHGLGDALNSKDPHRALNELLQRLQAVQDQPPPGFDPTSYTEGLRALLLSISPAVGGTHQDRAAGRDHRAAVVGLSGKIADFLPPGVGDPTVMGRAFELYSQVMDTDDTGNSEADSQKLRDLVTEAEALERTVPDGLFRGMVLMTLGAAYGKLGAVTEDRELLLRGLSYMEEGKAATRESGLPFGDEEPEPYLPDIDLLRAGLSGDRTTEVPEHVPPPPGASTEELYNSALSLGMRYGLSHDGAVLDRLIEELERVRDGIREGRAPRIAADALWQLAEAYRERAVHNEDVEDVAALEAAKEALSAAAADVLLQAGAEHGLLAARAGASRGVQAALWAAAQGQLYEAVSALELGRALVLHAASISSDVPELLDQRGQHELAEAWRAATATADRRACADGGVPGELPSTLRRRALDALGYRQDDGLLRTPTLGELEDGLTECGADALLYLVPGDAVGPGIVIAVGPQLGAGMGVRELLSRAESGPLERYLDAVAAHDASVREALRTGNEVDPAVRQAWEDALAELCDWACEVLGPVLNGLDKRLAIEGRPLRIVLVPCGRLGIVPWHAGRFPGESPREYLCQAAVISYAASGSQFLRTVRRAPRPPAAQPVLLADPSQDLMYAEIEVLALRNSFYPRARMCGTIPELGKEEPAPCTPEAVLSYLADGASLLHVASHGKAGTSPTASALDLTLPEDAAHHPDRGPRSGGSDPGPGLLTVARLLDGQDTRASDDGPLVVLSACQTDLSMRDHDEALTLTTGFVTAGARDVVGSRWAVSDGASALLMAVFHHYLNIDRLSPVDALRAAQLWMLDPERRNPGSLHDELLWEMDRPDLERIAYWAAFIHQGHPGPGEGEDVRDTNEPAGKTTIREGGKA
ncbi:CHAT domain-containing protein [Streptomyces wedmorensis]|uniref:CHAT domain-containing protein n=1 Tax=Streptomyces wedmorensis TaxID=43759 RepID=UPI003435F244